jgi:pimeloyl-ACP methyl ester carboxylesterase
MNKVYFISGLGADKRVFSMLDLSFCEPVFIDWITPTSRESLEHYALRLRRQISGEHPIIVGISLGGMLVTEMAKADHSIKGIIISSNKTAAEFPARLRIGRYMPVYKWMPAALSKRVMLGCSWILGGKTVGQKKLLKQILRDSDMQFVKWAIDAILHWKNKEIPSNIVHIHGTGDRLLPGNLVKADHIIKGGTHVMTMDNHDEISTLLRQLIQA